MWGEASVRLHKIEAGDFFLKTSHTHIFTFQPRFFLFFFLSSGKNIFLNL